jgi:hypothetical protein
LGETFEEGGLAAGAGDGDDAFIRDAEAIREIHGSIRN